MTFSNLTQPSCAPISAGINAGGRGVTHMAPRSTTTTTTTTTNNNNKYSNKPTNNNTNTVASNSPPKPQSTPASASAPVASTPNPNPNPTAPPVSHTCSPSSPPTIPTPPALAIDQKHCLCCKTTKTPLWRSGPNGVKTLCNACGMRWKKGKLYMNGILLKRPDVVHIAGATKKNIISHNNNHNNNSNKAPAGPVVTAHLHKNTIHKINHQHQHQLQHQHQNNSDDDNHYHLDHHHNYHHETVLERQKHSYTHSSTDTNSAIPDMPTVPSSAVTTAATAAALVAAHSNRTSQVAPDSHPHSHPHSQSQSQILHHGKKLTSVATGGIHKHSLSPTHITTSRPMTVWKRFDPSHPHVSSQHQLCPSQTKQMTPNPSSQNYLLNSNNNTHFSTLPISNFSHLDNSSQKRKILHHKVAILLDAARAIDGFATDSTSINQSQNQLDRLPKYLVRNH